MFEGIKKFFREGQPWGESMFRRHTPKSYNVQKCVVRIVATNDQGELQTYDRAVHGKMIYHKGGFQQPIKAEWNAKEIVQSWMEKGLLEIEKNKFLPSHRIKSLEICDVTDYVIET